ncbi:APC family permease [Paraferrimonas sp. SM1919]|uniref:APC family permease n=1 Tax=Paraferrimonas sp. SM1919 TaxID=2662263 RepID=UPI0013CFD5EE|nr:APC family permease [Paraferrimonas sp. SM1919]
MTTEHGLDKTLSTLDTLALAFGAMIGWSWVALMGDILAKGGSIGAVIGTLIIGVVILVIGFIYAELASAMPSVGGEHVYAKRALGVNGGFICTWAIIFVYVAVCAFEAVALPSVMQNLFPNLGSNPVYSVAGSQVSMDMVLIGSGASLVIMGLNIIGVRMAAFIQTIVVGVILLAGAMLIVGIGQVGQIQNMQPLFVNGGIGILATMAIMPFLMTGFDVIPQTAEEINLPPRKIGILLVSSIAFAISWYVLIELSVALILTPEARAEAPITTVQAAKQAFGDSAASMVLIAGIAGILTSWNGFMIGGSRAIFAMANDGMLPKWFAKVHPKYNTPVNALLFIGVLVTLAPFLGKRALIWFVDGGSFSLMIAYALVCLSFVKLRINEPDMPRPFKVKGGVGLGYFGFIAATIIGSFYLPNMPAALVWQEWLLVIAWFLFGYICYLTMPRRKVYR